MNVIYFLRCPRTGSVRYIGKTNAPSRRLRSHLSAARGGGAYRCSRWIRTLLAEGQKPEIEVLFVVPESIEWQVVERFFVAAARNFGLPITNTTSGGEGVIFAAAADFSRAKAARKAGLSTPEVRERLSAKAKEWASQPEVREQMSLRMRKLHADPEHKKLVREKSRLSNSRPEVKEKLSAAMLAVWARPGFRENRPDCWRTANPETRERHRAAVKAAHARPDVKALHSAAIRLSISVRRLVSSLGADAAVFVDTFVSALQDSAHG